MDLDADDLSASRVGTVLCDKWTLERLLGVGGMAAVYAARHRIGRLDAIKILHPEFARSEQVRARFEQEAHVLNRFRHPGAVEVRDLEKTKDGAPFIVMELLEGKSLATRVREPPPLTVDEVLRIADETLDVLAAAHEQKIIHRDIKPDNLFLLPNGSIKVLDFGIAQLRSGTADLKTKTGTTLGTVAYMPAEQVRGLDIDTRADIYSVGATMYRLLVGRCVHDANSEVELLMKVMSEPAPRLGTVLPSVRADVARIVDRALAYDRDARYPDARSMQAEVRVARGEKHAPLVEPLPPQSAVPTRTPQQQQLGALPTMAAAPGSALLAEAGPLSRKATRASDASPLPAVALPTRLSADAVSVPVPVSVAVPIPASLPSGVAAAQSGPVSLPGQEQKKRSEIAGVPLLWILIGAGLLFLLLAGLGLGIAGFALFHGKDSATPGQTPQPRATATATATDTATSPWGANPDDSADEPPPPHHGPPPGHGRGHKHKDEW
ncbi:MAG TPA: serine/threonine-protein kinase [Polyangiaceae bacterium]|nr:serine/threonine-protein kinase [Polyangiaceae bacterium]